MSVSIYFEPLVFLGLLPEYGLLAEDFLAWAWAAGAGVLAGKHPLLGQGLVSEQPVFPFFWPFPRLSCGLREGF